MKSHWLAVERCARCGENHSPMWFLPLIGTPNPHYSHWASCPNTAHPILMRIEQVVTPQEIKLKE